MKDAINAKNLIYLSILGAPLYLFRFKIFEIPTNLLEILILLTFFVWISSGGKFEKKNGLFFPIVLVLAGVILSALAGGNLLLSFGILKSWFILPILFGIIVGTEIKTAKEIDRILEALILSAFIVSLISLFYYFSGSLTYDNRLRSFYLSPNHLAMYLSPGFLAGMLKMSLEKNRSTPESILRILVLAVIFSAIYLTYSYASWIAIFSSYLIALILFSIYIRKSFLLKKIIIFLTILAILLFLQKDSSKLKDLTSLDERSSIFSRIMIWESSLKILSDNWLWGIGAGNFQEKYLEYQKYFPPYLEWAVPQPHNLYLAFWLQGGISGMIGFFWLIFIWIKEKVRFIKTSESMRRKKLALILLAIIFYILAHGLADTPYWKNDLSLIFWTTIFCGYSLFKLHFSPKP
ncbi:MAG: O-antigen ligase family protein [Candidatus Moranbacteria bacterium]|jgi:O-antigen ligase|nr:O-antigen ligase family protein [Candidatus Moranbacteria bacterium]MDX9855895.1 O-antigen ligase family protein [Candidatus Moranbacteria bacterium]